MSLTNIFMHTGSTPFAHDARFTLLLSALSFTIPLSDYFFFTLCLGFLVSVLGNQLASISEMSGTVDLSLKAFIWDCISWSLKNMFYNSFLLLVTRYYGIYRAYNFHNEHKQNFISLGELKITLLFSGTFAQYHNLFENKAGTINLSDHKTFWFIIITTDNLI